LAYVKTFYRPDGSEVDIYDTEDKDWWLQYGEQKEAAFLKFARHHRLLPGIAPNPVRAGGKNAGAPEFVYDGCPLDLKVQHQPFFEAERRYGIRPRFAVTLNYRDLRDIEEKYPDCNVVFWVNWIPTRYLKTEPRKKMSPKVIADISIAPLNGVWIATPQELFKFEDEAIRAGTHHWYQRRHHDNKGNAKSSYVIDIRKLKLLWLDPTCEPLT